MLCASVYPLQVDDRIMDLDAFKRFLAENIKLNGKKGELGDAIKVTMDRTKVTVTTHVAMSKRCVCCYHASLHAATSC